MMGPLNQERAYTLGAAGLAWVTPYIPTVSQCEAGLKLYGMLAGAVLVTIRIIVELRRSK